MKNTVIAVMVVYRPPEQVMRAVAAILPQVTRLVIVDNGDNADLQRELIDSYGDEFLWIDNPVNNLAAAQNLGIAAAKKQKARWVLLLDDDSVPASDFVAMQLQAVDAYSGTRPLAAVGCYYDEQAIDRAPHFYQPWLSVLVRKCTFDQAILTDILYVPASGCLISLIAIAEIGGMDDNLGLYFVDTEFCLRARAKGYAVIAVRDARLQHRFGRRSEHRLGGGLTVSTTNHHAAARYRMFHNRLILWKRFWVSQSAFPPFDMVRAVSEVVRIILFEEDKTQKLTAIYRALLGLPYERD